MTICSLFIEKMELQREKERENLPSTDLFPNGFNSQDSTRPKQEPRASSRLPVWCRGPNTWTILCSFNPGSWIRSETTGAWYGMPVAQSVAYSAKTWCQPHLIFLIYILYGVWVFGTAVRHNSGCPSECLRLCPDSISNSSFLLIPGHIYIAWS